MGPGFSTLLVECLGEVFFSFSLGAARDFMVEEMAKGAEPSASARSLSFIGNFIKDYGGEAPLALTLFIGLGGKGPLKLV